MGKGILADSPHISNKTNPQLVGSVDLPCGSHTATSVPDPTVTVPAVRVSQADGATIKAGLPATGTLSMNELAPRACHDTGVILGKVMKAVCAGHDGFSVWSMNAEDGGSFEDPALLYSKMVDADVTIGHSGIFSTDGKVIVFGHEPGGGTQPRCTATGTVLPGGLVQTDDMKSYFFSTRRAATSSAGSSFHATRPCRRTARSTTTT